MNKLCTKCKFVKPVDEFYRTNTKPIGHQSICKDCKGKAVKDWARRNPEKVKARNDKFNMLNREQRRQLYYRHKKELLTHYGNGECACVKCGEDRLPCLTVDHINGYGGEERRRVGGGFIFYRWLKNNDYPVGYQTLCMNCQLVKKHEQDENAKPRLLSSTYPIGFNKQMREYIRKRDNYTCQLCGMSEVENARRLIPHHIDYNKLNTLPSNLISLCNSCNAKVNGNREHWTIYFQAKHKLLVSNVRVEL